MRSDHFEPGYAIVRIDNSMAFASEPWTNRLTVKCVVWELAAAEAEVKRLNEINAEKGAIYFYQHTRVEKR